ncbi:hypothetical protein G9A89_001429 [Geosiphon pyriformis]|nr:hypothetical protein G9A89_001429 [Geosiphon pyriformis]
MRQIIYSTRNEYNQKENSPNVELTDNNFETNLSPIEKGARNLPKFKIDYLGSEENFKRAVKLIPPHSFLNPSKTLGHIENMGPQHFFGDSNEDEFYQEKVEDEQVLQFLADMAFYAQEAYCLNDRVGKIGNNVYGYAVENKRTTNIREIVFYFRGVKINTERQWRLRPYAQVEYEPPESREWLIETEIYRNFKSAENNILKTLKSFANETYYYQYRVRFTGHGFGGVYAVLAGLTWKRRDPKSIVQIITFGQPRFSTQFLSEYINQVLSRFLIYRITNFDDFVPQYPPLMYWSYVHIGTEFWISNQLGCDCFFPETNDPIPNVYMCYGKGIIGGMLRENPNCNNQNFESRSETAHNGPYFGYLMGECPKI